MLLFASGIYELFESGQSDIFIVSSLIMGYVEHNKKNQLIFFLLCSNLIQEAVHGSTRENLQSSVLICADLNVW